tara:strand:+ start:371 stop:1273 length:903 start_codon:yes stop_codon:yes gene_type:complete
MISFIIPFSTIEKNKFLNLNEKETLWEENNAGNIIFSTIQTIEIINKLKGDKEIILVDNSHTWPEIDLPNLKVVKGWQALPKNQLLKTKGFMNHSEVELSLENIGCLTMWVSMAFHCGIQHAKGDYIILQHNDIFYHNDFILKLITHLERDELGYISVDNKKVWLSTYLARRRLLFQHIGEEKFSPMDGGYVKTEFGFADAYFFLTRRSFFDNYNVDWCYGDTNHGATIKCLQDKVKYLHLGPYYDNPNFNTSLHTLNTYFYNDEPFLSHLKGGFSEHKMTSEDFESELNRYLTGLNNAK